MERVDLLRLDAGRRLDPDRRSAMGQFLTPGPTARLMASMFHLDRPEYHLLDPGAGVGSLTAAWIAELCSREHRPSRVTVTAYEIDPILLSYLEKSMRACEARCNDAGVHLIWRIERLDFLSSAVNILDGGFFAPERLHFTAAILNPPYRKIHSDSAERAQLRRIGIETSNLYSAFLALVVRLLERDAELVAITPRSFCNGPYFRPFRELFLSEMTIRRVHMFESRARAFSDDDVLQENVILHAQKTTSGREVPIAITTAVGPEDDHPIVQETAYADVVKPGDPESFIHLISDQIARRVSERMERFITTLSDLRIAVSTGRVVDFRARQFLRQDPESGAVPLIYPAHFSNGFVCWPKSSARKPNAFVANRASADLLVPSGTYVLVRRFSAKEEPRRIVAALYDPSRLPRFDVVAFENHLNYFHTDGRGLPVPLARGLAIFLNSTLVDEYFRLFNGHTQVNATDLRALRYPDRLMLERLSSHLFDQMPSQEEIDGIIESEFFNTKEDRARMNPIHVKRRIGEAIVVLDLLGLPRGQQNDRSAMALLALLDLPPAKPWSKATDPLRGVWSIMQFIEDQYGRKYAPNTRETIRRFTLHQFIDAGIVLLNPDRRDRPTNSPDNVYRVESGTLALLRTFGTSAWDSTLAAYLASTETLRQRYAQEREMAKIAVVLAGGKRLTLSPGGQNVLIKEVIEQFVPRFAPAARLLYIGDAEEKFRYFDEKLLSQIGITIAEHGKMPDVIVYDTRRNWLFLIEAVTSHGPVNPKRRAELRRLFARSTAGLIYVTAFVSRKAMVRYLSDISYETEVWTADAPTHMIHFDGEKFLGPFE